MDFSLLSPRKFEQLCQQLLEAEGFSLVQVSDRSRDVGVDLTVLSPKHQKWIVQAKRWHRSTLPTGRFRLTMSELHDAKSFLNVDGVLLIVTNVVPQSLLDSLQLDSTFHLWDKTVLENHLNKHPNVKSAFFPSTTKSATTTRDQLLTVENVDARAKDLRQRLESLPHGESHWRDFEEVCVEILNYAFIPPLRAPKIQSRSEDGLDRRDAIYSIGYGHPFWDGLRNEARTRFAVAEFKNGSHAPGQKDVESIQQYLYKEAMRTVGILCSRQQPSESALRARRRAWVEFGKLILFVSDNEIKEILDSRDAGEDPTETLDAQLIEFFALLCP
jgi:hypothetical protein